jgi:hypothetical protein
MSSRLLSLPSAQQVNPHISLNRPAITMKIETRRLAANDASRGAERTSRARERIARAAHVSKNTYKRAATAASLR